MTWKMHVAYLDRERYAKHAAIQSIAAVISDVEREMRKAAEEISWLRALSDTRLEQMDAGLWPPKQVSS